VASSTAGSFEVPQNPDGGYVLLARNQDVSLDPVDIDKSGDLEVQSDGDYTLLIGFTKV